MGENIAWREAYDSRPAPKRKSIVLSNKVHRHTFYKKRSHDQLIGNSSIIIACNVSCLQCCSLQLRMKNEYCQQNRNILQIDGSIQGQQIPIMLLLYAQHNTTHNPHISYLHPFTYSRDLFAVSYLPNILKQRSNFKTKLACIHAPVAQTYRTGPIGTELN